MVEKEPDGGENGDGEGSIRDFLSQDFLTVLATTVNRGVRFVELSIDKLRDCLVASLVFACTCNFGGYTFCLSFFLSVLFSFFPTVDIVQKLVCIVYLDKFMLLVNCFVRRSLNV